MDRTERLKAIAKRVAKISPRPWKLFRWKDEPGYKAAVVAFDIMYPALNSAAIYGTPDRINPNAEFVYHAGLDVPFLLDDIKALSAAAETARATLLFYHENGGYVSTNMRNVIHDLDRALGEPLTKLKVAA